MRARDIFRLWHFIITHRHRELARHAMPYHGFSSSFSAFLFPSLRVRRTIRKSNKQRSKKLINSISFVYVC